MMHALCKSLFISPLLLCSAVSCYAQCSGAWSPIQGVSGASFSVSALAYWDPDGAGTMPPGLIAGGSFSISGVLGSGNIAQWDGVSWHALGSGFPSGNVDCMLVAADGTLIVGGSFFSAGGVSAANIARWDGAAWSALGGGTDGEVLALAVAANGDLYAGGAFTTAGDITANRVAYWDGVSWNSLGSGSSNGVSSIVYALAIRPSGSVYVGGSFHSAGGSERRHIARWNGSDWNSVGGGTNSGVYGLATAADGSVYATGAFTTAGGLTVNRIARWDGQSWSALGSGLNAEAYTLLPMADGSVYVGGQFVFAGGMPASRVARWDGSHWTTLGTGAGSYVVSLAAAPQDQLFVGGTFSSIGGLASPGVGMWTAANTVISDQPQDAQACRGTMAHYEVVLASGTPMFGWEYRTNGGMWTGAQQGQNSDQDGNIFTCSEPTLKSIDVRPERNVGTAQTLEFRCVLTDACGAISTSSVSLAYCEADFNCDGALDFFDYLDFLAAFAAGDSAADFNSDDAIDFFDYLDFVDSMASGC